MTKLQKMIISSTMLAVLLVGSIIFWQKQKTQVGDFQGPVFDKNAIQGEPDSLSEEMKYTSISVAEGYQVSMCGNATVVGDQLFLYVTSSKENTVWIKTCILDLEGNKIGESGIIRPGEYITDVTLTSVPRKDTKLTVKIISYEPETFYSKGVAPITIGFNVEKSK